MNSLHVITRSIHSQISTPTASLSTTDARLSNVWPPAALQPPNNTRPTNSTPDKSRQALIPISPHRPAAATHTPTLATPSYSNALVSSTSSITHATAPPASFTSHTIVVQDRSIAYNRDLLLPPPHRDYAANPELLADDWEHLTIMVHAGRPEDVGVKYWKQLYKGTKHWDRLRKNYSDWAVCITSIVPPRKSS